MNSLSDKPGVLGAVGNLGNAIKQGTTSEIKKTVVNTVEQLGVKENKEKEPTEADAAAQAEAMKKHSEEMTNWLYGTSSNESTPPTPTPSVPKPEGLADLKQQLGLEQKVANTANVVEQLGVSQNTAPTASLTEQLNFGQNPTLTAEQQAKQKQLQQQLHGAYYQQLVNPQPQQSDTEERIKEKQEEQETQQQRMDRLEQEDLQKKQKEEEKKQPVAVDQAQNMEKHRGSMG